MTEWASVQDAAVRDPTRAVQSTPPRRLDANGKTTRSVGKTSLRTMASWLPPALRRALVRELIASHDQYEIFQLLGRSHGVRDVRIVGDYGPIEGAIDDNGVMRAYAVAKTWADPGNRVFMELFDRKGGGTYIDIGANIGLTTIPIAQNPAVACKAFEPAPANFRYLTNNVALNCSHGNVELFNLALFDRTALLDFELSDDNLGDHRIRLGNGEGLLGESRRTVVQVTANRLDDLVGRASLAAPLAVKIATQGAEAQVFAGGRSTLAAADMLAFEFWPYGIARAGGDVDLIGAFIRANFRFGALIAGGTKQQPVWQPIDAIVERLATFAAQKRYKPYDYYDGFARKTSGE